MTVKLIEFSPHGLSLSALHTQKFAAQEKLPWEIELFPAFDEGLLADAVGAWVDLEISEAILQGLSAMPSISNALTVSCAKMGLPFHAF
jgi:hypothetical protein